VGSGVLLMKGRPQGVCKVFAISLARICKPGASLLQL
jgi:hypothetical protein